MENAISLSWWISVVEIPVFMGMFWIVRNHIGYLEKCIKDNEKKVQKDIISIMGNVATLRVDVAVNYASISYIKDVENRLTAHLLRIEDKISGGS
ncbi:MAG: hypothetical protein LBO78_03990 [Rickettsiales bacterium]|jgi:hypothetical protein|nr:hypothetical protein [Rickettsiales bacterium]